MTTGLVYLAPLKNLGILYKVMLLNIIFALMILWGVPASANEQGSLNSLYRWLSPDHCGVVTTRSVRLAIDIGNRQINEGKEVIFYATYVLNSGEFVQRKEIGRINRFPYEMVWDCGIIPDQTIQFYGEVADRTGKRTAVPLESAFGTDGPSVILDRNPKLNDSRLRSHRVRKEPVIDGDLREWAARDSIVFNNNDNRITVYSVWDSRSLYFAVQCLDRSIIGYDEIGNAAIYDIIELYLDPDHDHAPLWVLPDRHYLIPAAGRPYERIVPTRMGKAATRTDFAVSAAARVYGTLGVESDIDSCYTIELAVPWKHLGVKPGNSRGMGLEVWNNDRDFIRGNYFYSGWTTATPVLGNTSEWGNLDFVEDSGGPLAGLILAGAILAGITGLIFVYFRARIANSDSPVILPTHSINPVSPSSPNPNAPALEKESIIAAKIYIDDHFSEESLSREEVARFVGLTPSYFGKLFSRETGASFTDYLNTVRLEKAKLLLVGTSKNISEIAYEVGFGNLSYFGFVFRKQEKISPRQYRSTHFSAKRPQIKN